MMWYISHLLLLLIPFLKVEGCAIFSGGHCYDRFNTTYGPVFGTMTLQDTLSGSGTNLYDNNENTIVQWSCGSNPNTYYETAFTAGFLIFSISINMTGYTYPYSITVYCITYGSGGFSAIGTFSQYTVGTGWNSSADLNLQCQGLAVDFQSNCNSAFREIIIYGQHLDTMVPTAVPTPPTGQPTRFPTKTPTKIPTMTPSKGPTPDVCPDYFVNQSCCSGNNYNVTETGDVICANDNIFNLTNVCSNSTFKGRVDSIHSATMISSFIDQTCTCQYYVEACRTQYYDDGDACTTQEILGCCSNSSISHIVLGKDSNNNVVNVTCNNTNDNAVCKDPYNNQYNVSIHTFFDYWYDKNVNNYVINYCSCDYNHNTCIFPTVPPTNVPTIDPTKVPSKVPTSVPIAPTTPSPTFKPTNATITTTESSPGFFEQNVFTLGGQAIPLWVPFIIVCIIGSIVSICCVGCCWKHELLCWKPSAEELQKREIELQKKKKTKRMKSPRSPKSNTNNFNASTTPLTPDNNVDNNANNSAYMADNSAYNTSGFMNNNDRVTSVSSNHYVSED